MSRPVIHRLRPFLAAAALIAALALMGTPAAAQAAGELTVSPTELDFPATTVGNQAAHQQVTVKNTGDAPVSISNVFVDGSNPSDFNVNGNCGGQLNPGQGCGFDVGFSPGGAGARQATLHVSSDDPRGDQTVELTGTGADPELSFEPSSYDFGVQYVNRGGTQANLTLRNTGDAAVQVNSVDITGPGSGAFWTGFVSCYGATLQPNDTCSVQVWFGPNDTVPFAAQVRAWTNGTSFAADLTGSGGQALVTGSPNPVEFGTATAGQQGGTQTVTLTNNGQLPGGFFVAVVSGGDVASFRLLHENCTGVPLDPSASCTAQVRFQPDGAGPKEAQLSFFGDQDGGAQVTLLGTGVDPRASLTPDNHDFGRLQVGDTSRAQAFDLTNDGHTPLKMSGASIVGDDADQFRLAGDECTDVTLPAGASCQVQVRFAPDARGARSARLRLLGDGGSLTASLTGAGTPKGKALVSFHWRDTLRANRGALVAGDASCNSDSPCKLHARAILRGRVGRGAAARRVSVKLPPIRLRLGAGVARSLRLRLPGVARATAEGGEHLRLLLDWSSGGRSGEIRAGRRLGG